MEFTFPPKLLLVSMLTAVLFGTAFHGHAAPVPAPFMEAFASFRAEGAQGYCHTQESKDDENTCVVERFDPSRPEAFRWELVSRNGQVCSEEEQQRYLQDKLVRSSHYNAPRLEKMLDLGTCEVLEEGPVVMRCRFKLVPGEAFDSAHENLEAVVWVDLASRTIVRVELANTKPFSAGILVRVDKTRTTMEYSKRTSDMPSLLLRARVELEAKTFWLFNRREGLTVTWSGHRKPAPRLPASSQP